MSWKERAEPHKSSWRDRAVAETPELPKEPGMFDFGANLDNYKSTLDKAIAGDEDAAREISGKSAGMALGGLGSPLVKSVVGAGEAALGEASSLAKKAMPAMKDIPWDSASDLAINALPIGPGTRLTLHTVKSAIKKAMENRAARAAEGVAEEVVAPAVSETAPAVREAVSGAITKRFDPISRQYVEGPARSLPPRREEVAPGLKYDPFLKKYR